MYQKTYTADHQDHHGAQAVDNKGDIEIQSTESYPGCRNDRQGEIAGGMRSMSAVHRCRLEQDQKTG